MLAHVHDQLDTPDRVGELRCLKGHRSPVNSVTFSPDSRYAISGSGGELVDGLYTDGEDRVVSIWNLADGKPVARFEKQATAALCVAWSPSGSHVLTSSRSGNLYYIDARDVAIYRRLAKHGQIVFSTAFSPDGGQVVSGCDDGVVRVWDLSGRRINRYEGHQRAVTSVAYSPNGRWIVSGSLDRTARLWDTHSGQAGPRLLGHTRSVLSVAFSPDNTRVASAGADGTVRLWQAETGAEIRCIHGHEGTVSGVAFTPVGDRVLSGSSDMTVRLWEIASGAEVCCFTEHSGAVKSVAVSPGGRRALSGSADCTVRVWCLPT